jgi:hypothetical protein
MFWVYDLASLKRKGSPPEWDETLGKKRLGAPAKGPVWTESDAPELKRPTPVLELNQHEPVTP